MGDVRPPADPPSCVVAVGRRRPRTVGRDARAVRRDRRHRPAQRPLRVHPGLSRRPLDAGAPGVAAGDRPRGAQRCGGRRTRPGPGRRRRRSADRGGAHRRRHADRRVGTVRRRRVDGHGRERCGVPRAGPAGARGHVRDVRRGPGRRVGDWAEDHHRLDRLDDRARRASHEPVDPAAEPGGAGHRRHRGTDRRAARHRGRCCWACRLRRPSCSASASPSRWYRKGCCRP